VAAPLGESVLNMFKYYRGQVAEARGQIEHVQILPLAGIPAHVTVAQ